MLAHRRVGIDQRIIGLRRLAVRFPVAFESYRQVAGIDGNRSRHPDTADIQERGDANINGSVEGLDDLLFGIHIIGASLLWPSETPDLERMSEADRGSCGAKVHNL